MEASIRQALLAGKKVPPNELTPDEWVDVINQILGNIRPLAKHMRLPMSTEEHVRGLQQARPEAELTVTGSRQGKPLSGTFRIALLGTLYISSWDCLVIALGQDGHLRLIRIRAGLAETPSYSSEDLSNERFIGILRDAPGYTDGQNLLAMWVVQALADLLDDNAKLKAKQAQSFVLAVEGGRQILAPLDM